MALCAAELGRVLLASEYEAWRTTELALARTREKWGTCPESRRCARTGTRVVVVSTDSRHGRLFGRYEKALCAFGFSR